MILSRHDPVFPVAPPLNLIFVIFVLQSSKLFAGCDEFFMLLYPGA